MTTPGPFSDHVAKPSQPRAVCTFEQLAAQKDDDIDVVLGASLVARDVYGGLDVGALLTKLDELAAPLVSLNLASRSADEQAIEIGHYLYEVLGFRGNESEYYDPKNSLLPDVLLRRLGIPITLALVYCEVAKRVGVVARGVSFPGHFLVRIDPSRVDPPDTKPLFVDPFFGGRVLDETSLERLLRRSTSPNESLKAEHLSPASPRTILVRMLINLKWIYMTRGDLARALLALDRILSLTPENAAALRERGMLAARLGAVEAARADLTRLLEVNPDLADANMIRARIEELRIKASKRALN
jgi:regulator of sirC expression with transglutaminase-like and TPR domain